MVQPASQFSVTSLLDIDLASCINDLTFISSFFVFLGPNGVHEIKKLLQG